MDCVESFGSRQLSLQEILQPAIELAQNGFSVSGPITSELWKKNSNVLLQKNNEFGKELLVTGTYYLTKCYAVCSLETLQAVVLVSFGGLKI